jgi:hypothetical protein
MVLTTAHPPMDEFVTHGVSGLLQKPSRTSSYPEFQVRALLLAVLSVLLALLSVLLALLSGLLALLSVLLAVLSVLLAVLSVLLAVLSVLLAPVRHRALMLAGRCFFSLLSPAQW